MRAIRWLWLVLLGGCAQPLNFTSGPPIQINLTTPYDDTEALRLSTGGTSTIRGSAFLRQRGGGVVTCAGATVLLVPGTAYATERMVAIYGSVDSAILTRPSRVVFEPQPPAFLERNRTATCDAQGNFVFDRLGDGTFYLVVPVRWLVGYEQQGGMLMKRVLVAPAATLQVVVTQP